MNATQRFNFFLVSAKHKKNSGNSGATNELLQKRSNNIFDKKITVVNGVEHQQSGNIKNGKTGCMVFRRIDSYFIDTCDKRHTERHPDIGSKVELNDKAHQTIIEKSMAEKNGHIHRTDQNTPQTSHRKNLMSSKEKHI